PHEGHRVLAELQKRHPGVRIITQNIDGMHQRAGSSDVIELHGSLWRVRCEQHGVWEDRGETYQRRTCPHCGTPLRPDIVWFEDRLDPYTINAALYAIRSADLFISIGTSGVVWPAAGFPQIAKDNGALCIEINPEANELSSLYDRCLRGKAGEVLPELFVLDD
ncbi:MAG: NAD-dependent deacylase, partial [Syntrophales bacterium]|nr:NAD-dependent deacylase [Syntrophales bacterium]